MNRVRNPSKYTWGVKEKSKVHIATPEGTLCKLQNGTGIRLLVCEGGDIPHGRRLCSICEQKRKREIEKVFKKDKSKKQLAKMARKASRLKRAAKGDGFYSSWEWHKARYQILTKYGAVCMLCHSTERIVVDHIKPRSKFPELELDLDNLQVLCNACNRGKSNDDFTDFRPGLSDSEVIELQLVSAANERI